MHWSLADLRALSRNEYDVLVDMLKRQQSGEPDENARDRQEREAVEMGLR
jgi:phage-related baseplate assembly protein